MSLTNMSSRMAMAEKLSIPQLQQAIQSGSLPAYVGIPLLQEKMKMQKAGQATGQQTPQSSIAEQVMGEAQTMGGVDQLPSNLPIDGAPQGMAGGGIVAFADRGLVYGEDEPEDRRSSSDRAMDAVIAEIMQSRRFNSQTASQTPQTNAPTSELPYDPVTEGASSAAQEPRFVGGETGGRAYVGYRKQKGAGSGTPKGQEPVLPNQELSALDFDAPTTVLPTTVVTSGREPDATLDNKMLADSFNPPPKGTEGGVGTLAGVNRTGATQPTAQLAQPAQTTEPAQKSALDQYAEMLMAERGGDAKAREEAKAMALIQAGLGIAGGTSPNALANIAQGALPATQAYQQTMQGIRKEDRERIKQLMELGVSKEKLALEARRLGIEDRKIDGLLARYAGAGGAADAKRDQLAFRFFESLRKDQLMSGKSNEEIWAEAQQMAGKAMGEGASAPTGSTTVDWSNLGKPKK